MYVGKETSASPKLTRADVRCANWLEDFAEFRDAHAAGKLFRQHIDLLRNQADTPHTFRVGLFAAEKADAPRQRSIGRRNAEALVALAAKGSLRADGTMASPLIQIVASAKVAENVLKRLDDDSVDIGLGYDDPDGRCEFIDGTPVHPAFLLAVMGVATFRRHIFGAESRPDVSVNARAFPQWMKDAALVESRGRCTSVGCDAAVRLRLTKQVWLRQTRRAALLVPASITPKPSAAPRTRPNPTGGNRELRAWVGRAQTQMRIDLAASDRTNAPAARYRGPGCVWQD